MTHRNVSVRLQVDYELEIPKNMRMDEVLEHIVDKFQCEHLLSAVGIDLVDRTDDKLIRLRPKNDH